MENPCRRSTENIRLKSYQKLTTIVWSVPEAKVTPNWQKVFSEELANHLTTCGFNFNLKRPRVKRQLARLMSQEHEPGESLFIEDLKIVEDCDPTSQVSVEQNHDKCSSKPEPQKFRNVVIW